MSEFDARYGKRNMRQARVLQSQRHDILGALRIRQERLICGLSRGYLGEASEGAENIDWGIARWSLGLEWMQSWVLCLETESEDMVVS
jgi:hypothetical protein